MDYLFTLKDSDVFEHPAFPEADTYEKRTTVKAIVVNDSGEYGFVTNSVHNCVLLAGGGAESDDLEKEIVRECLEEIQYEVEVNRLIGFAHEYRNRESIEYETACYVVKVLRGVDVDTRTADEKANELTVVWLGDQEALKALEGQMKMVQTRDIGFYNTSFNVIRDHRFFVEFLSVMKS